MGCLKLPYDQEPEPLPFLSIWKKKSIRKTDLQEKGASEEKKWQPIFCNSYTPFGLTFNSYQRVTAKENNYKFNGKEWQNNLGLYHYGARFYDPAVALFTTIDPKAESFAAQGGYVYAANNPIAFHEKNGENPVLGIFRYVAKKVTNYAAKRAAKSAQKKALQKSQKSLQKNVKEHIAKHDEFMKDPIKNSGDDAMKQMTKDNPSDNVLLERAKGRGDALMKQVQKNQGELAKVNKQLKEMNKGADNLKAGSVAVVATATANQATSAATESLDVDATVSVIKKATTIPGQVDTEQAANLGKTVLGDNAAGRFIDDWVNPFGIADDLKTLIIIGVMSTSDGN